VLLVLAADKAIKDHLDFELKQPRKQPAIRSRDHQPEPAHVIEVAPVLTMSRAVSLISFVTALLKGFWHKDVLTSLACKITHANQVKSFIPDCVQGLQSLFIKVDDAGVINRDFLWRLVARGAAVMC